MTKQYEPKALQELPTIRDEIHREAMATRFDRYYEELDKEAGWLLGKKHKNAARR